MISYLLIFLLVSASGVYIILRLNHLDGTIRSMITVDAQAIRLAREIAQAVYIQVGFEKKYLISGDQDFLNQFAEMNSYLASKTAELDRLVTDPEIKILSAFLKVTHERYRDRFGKMASNEIIISRPDESDKIMAEMETTARQIMDRSDKARNQKLRASGEISAQITKAMTISGSVVIILTVLISILITRSINAPIELLLEKTKMTAQGEFGQPLEISSPPEIKELAESFNTMCMQLQELDQMKIDFISHLSHELRTPLTAIKEASCMLMEGVYAESHEKQRELFDIVNGECERLIASVSRILDLSRMEAGMAEFQFDLFDMAPIIQNVTVKLEPIADRKNIALSLDIPGSIPEVRMDEEKIRQVIENLVGNALKFTAEGGEVRIALAENSKDRLLEVTVSDTGCGIPSENLQEIFDKFKRVDNRRGAVRGTGLGLAIARHIINAHGGSIWAESKPGKGSAFTFSLPLSSASS